MRNLSVVVAGLAGLTLMFGACTSSGTKHELGSQWRSPGKSTNYERIVVVALTDKKDRIALENRMVADLKAKGLQAIPSYESWRDLRETGFESFNAWVNRQGVDAVVTIETEFARVVTEQDHAAAMVNADFTEVVEASWTTAEVVDDAVIEVILWNAASWKPVWSGRSETISVEELGPAGIASFASVTLVENDVL